MNLQEYVHQTALTLCCGDESCSSTALEDGASAEAATGDFCVMPDKGDTRGARVYT
jgi:hypothetical protein